MSTSILVAAALAASGIYAPSDYDVRSMYVDVHRYDLTTAKGQARLERRIQVIARRVCRDPGVAPGDYGWRNDECYAAAMTKVRAQVDQAIAEANPRH